MNYSIIHKIAKERFNKLPNKLTGTEKSIVLNIYWDFY